MTEKNPLLLNKTSKKVAFEMAMDIFQNGMTSQAWMNHVRSYLVPKRRRTPR